MNLKSLMLAGAMTASFMVASTSALAATYMPFVLGSISDESVDTAAATAKSALEANGFRVIGTYRPVADREVIIVTNNALTTLASQSKYGGFGAIERVSVVKRNNVTEVSYTNPTYLWNVYRMKGDITPIQAAMEKALGHQKEFGAEEGLSADDLRDYHYKMLMPYFDDEDELAEYDSHAEAVSVVENNLAAGKAGVKQVYKLDIPNSDMTVFGVSFSKGESADAEVLSLIDVEGYSHTAHLPYEMLVVGGEVIALNAKFRIAINWPSLSMMGSGSFMSIANAPDEIEESLEAVATK